MFKSTIFVVLAAVSAVFAEDKVEAGCRPCNNPCPRRCLESTAKLAGELLVPNLCTSFKDKNLALLQGGIVTPKSTLQTIIKTPTGCVDSGVQNFIATAINLMPLLQCPNGPVITNVYVDAKGRVIVFDQTLLLVGGQEVNVSCRWVLEPVDGQCEFKIIEGRIVDDLCS